MVNSFLYRTFPIGCICLSYGLQWFITVLFIFNGNFSRLASLHKSMIPQTYLNMHTCKQLLHVHWRVAVHPCYPSKHSCLSQNNCSQNRNWVVDVNVWKTVSFRYCQIIVILINWYVKEMQYFLNWLNFFIALPCVVLNIVFWRIELIIYVFWEYL